MSSYVSVTSIGLLLSVAGCSLSTSDYVAPLDATTAGPALSLEAGSLDAQVDGAPAAIDAAQAAPASLHDASTVAVDGSVASDAGAALPPDGGGPAIAMSDPSKVTERWWMYTRPADYSFVKSPVKVPLRDGASLGCTLSRPAHGTEPASGRFPGLVVQFTPYFLNMQNFEKEAAFFAQRGYNAIVCTLRGIGDSSGAWQGVSSNQERRDGHDLIEWLAVQPYSDGRIGQFGESYGGQTTYGSAMERPPHLRAIAGRHPWLARAVWLGSSGRGRPQLRARL